MSLSLLTDKPTDEDLIFNNVFEVEKKSLVRSKEGGGNESTRKKEDRKV